MHAAGIMGNVGNDEHKIRMEMYFHLFIYSSVCNIYYLLPDTCAKSVSG